MYGNNYPDDYTNMQGIYSGYSSVPPAAPQPPKKQKGAGVWKKLLIACCVGLCFGVFAGAGFYGVKSMVGKIESLQDGKEPEKNFVSGGITAEIEAQDEAPKPEAPAVETVAAIPASNSVKAITTDVTQVVQDVMPAVVSITNVFTQTSNFFGQRIENQGEASGSGIIVGENDTELLVVTNYHVIEGADTLSVQFIDGEQANAQVKGYDSDKDLAVIAIPLNDIQMSTHQSITIAKLGDSDALLVGEPAIAIGNALGYGQSVTTGVISALNRTVKNTNNGNELIQTDAAINPGNSGGALLNVRGEVVGINSNKIGGAVVEGMGYAIPISSAKPIIEELMSKATKTKVEDDQRAYLGISGVNVTEEVSRAYNMPRGVYLGQVYEGTAAEKAGLVRGDIITKFDGNSVASMEELKKMLQYYAAGEEVEITIQQGDSEGYQEKKVLVTLGKKEQQ